MRFFYSDQVDLWANDEETPRDDRLRELVDELPERERHLVSRIYFGGAALKTAAAELGVSPPTARNLLERALESLGAALRSDD